MLQFNEDRQHTYKKGTKNLVKVQMYFDDGSMQEITDVEPTMVLVGWEDFNRLKEEHQAFSEIINKTVAIASDYSRLKALEEQGKLKG